MIKSTSYDFIFLGAGCATLSLLMRMLKSSRFSDQKFLLIDKDAKKNNDRTWCFWEQENGFFDGIVYKKWNTISFLSDTYSSAMDITPYQYKMIRGIDFYSYCLNEISRHANVEFVKGDIGNWEYENEALKIEVNNKEYLFNNTILFNSIYQPNQKSDKTIRLLQHFKGWIIEANKPVFDPDKATMMDFRVHQNNGTSFIYVMPFNSTTALVEYTLFTKELLKSEEYDKEIQHYIQEFLKIDNFSIKEKEFGIIPMTNEQLSFKNNGWNIGTAGGQTKGSSGYTFQFIQKQSQQILNCLLANKPLDTMPAAPRRFRFYDNTLLEILYYNKLPGREIFATLFKKNKAQQVLRFLDNETNLKDELKIISTLPTWPFLKAAMKQFN